MLKLVILANLEYGDYYEPVVDTYQLDEFVPPDARVCGYGIEECDESGKSVARIVNFWCDEEGEDLDTCRELFDNLKLLVDYINTRYGS